MSEKLLEAVKFDERGLVPAIVQDVQSGQVIMLAYMNREALERTLASGYTWFYSRSRQALWHKGETSGHVQKVEGIFFDCDADALLVKVEQAGVGCHTGRFSCFHRDRDGNEVVAGGEDSPQILLELYALIQQRQRERPEGSYTAYLFNEGLDKILKKVGEESAEVIIAAKNGEAGPLTYELADLLYHLLVTMVDRGIDPRAVFRELQARR